MNQYSYLSLFLAHPSVYPDMSFTVFEIQKKKKKSEGTISQQERYVHILFEVSTASGLWLHRLLPETLADEDNFGGNVGKTG